MRKRVCVIGAGLAGCEATWQLVKRGIPVTLYEMRPHKLTPAHQSGDFAELVCSNSLRSDSLHNAVGVLKAEMRMFDSLIMRIADAYRIPAGSALAVDRKGFAQAISEELSNHPLVQIVRQEVKEIPDQPCIIAAGPLVSDSLSEAIQRFVKADYFHFYDAAAPIIERDSIDFSKAYLKSRYDKGEAAYINCPMNQEQFQAFYHELIHAQTTHLHEFEQETYFEGCMPFEEMARRGMKTLLYGPMKPVGLEMPDGTRPYAVVQLRADNAAASLYNIVGFQTHLTWPEQRRILAMIPGLEHASIVRYGVMHRNSYLCAPKVLQPTYQAQARADLFFAGQLSGVEGYVESAASGMLAGLNMANIWYGKQPIELPATCVCGAMAQYITHANPAYFQPMNANFGLMYLDAPVKKKERKDALARQALAVMQAAKENLFL